MKFGGAGTRLSRSIAILSVSALLLGSCGAKEVRFPMRSTITGVVWGGDGGLYALDFPESADTLIWRIHDHSAEKVQIPPIRDACDAPSPRAIFPLPNGWGAAMGCGGSIHVVAVTQAGAERLATVTNIGGIATVAWNSSAAVGVIGQGSYWCSSMLPVAQGKLPAWPSVLGGKLVDEGSTQA